MQKNEVEKTETKKINWVKEILSWILVIAGGFVLAWFVTRVIIVKAVVPTNSMETTIMVGDKIIGNRLSYTFSNPKRGDIVIFEFPDDPTQDYVKRIIGLPGETISFDDGKVLVDGKALEENYTNGQRTEYHNEQTYVVPEGSYFMLGDNREVSADSRYWDNPFVKKSAIKGKVWLRYSPSWGKIK
ncbi:MAG: signal peptidase I [Clostridiales bacterium]|nr:signal peptidase I [Clostridiales bacterium]